MNVNQLILDYVAVCERRGEILGLQDFMGLWKAASDLADETAPEEREAVLRSIFAKTN